MKHETVCSGVRAAKFTYMSFLEYKTQDGFLNKFNNINLIS